MISKPRQPACCPELPHAIVFSLMYSLLPWTMIYDVTTARGNYLRCEPSMYLQVSPDLNAGTHRAHSCQVPRLRIPGGPAVHPRQAQREGWQHDVMVHIDVGIFTCACLLIDPNLCKASHNVRSVRCGKCTAVMNVTCCVAAWD